MDAQGARRGGKSTAPVRLQTVCIRYTAKRRGDAIWNYIEK